MSAEAYNYGMRRRESFFRIAEEMIPTPKEPNTTPSRATELMNGVRANSSMTRDAEQVRRMMDAAKIGNEARIDWSARMTDEQIAELSADNPAKPRLTEGPSLQRESIPFPDLGVPLQASVQQLPPATDSHIPVAKPDQLPQIENQILPEPPFAEFQDTPVAIVDDSASELSIAVEIPIEEIESKSLISTKIDNPQSLGEVALSGQTEPLTVCEPSAVALPIKEVIANVPQAEPVQPIISALPRTIDPSQYRRAEQHIVEQAAEVVEKTTKNGHQTTTSDFPTAANYSYQQVTPVAHAKTIIEDKKQESLFIGRPKRERKRIGKVALSTVVALGALTGLGLYAGGADLLSTWFANRQEGVETATRTVLPTALDSTASFPPASAQPQFGQTANIEVISSSNDTGVIVAAAQAQGTTVEAPKASDSVVGNTFSTPPVRATEAPAQPFTDSQPTQQLTIATPTTASKVVVQVRATPDPVEAKRIARKLRNTGITTVSVMEADNRSTTLHRVRFEFAGSKEEAIAAAERAGYSDVWVVKQK